jgi:hypothetical protein
MEFFLGFYDFEEDLLRVVEKSRHAGKALETFNTIFLTLVPKKDNPAFFY